MHVTSMGDRVILGNWSAQDKSTLETSKGKYTMHHKQQITVNRTYILYNFNDPKLGKENLKCKCP